MPSEGSFSVRYGEAVSREGWPTGTVTFLFTDIEASTALWAQDSDAMAASLALHDDLFRSSVEAHGGFVFSTAGDSFAVAFGRASDAVHAAATTQEALAGVEWPGPVPRVRMGLHLGEAEERGGDFFGPVVNTAARVEAAGHGGQVLMTELVRAAAEIADERVLDLGMHQLRDVPGPVRLFQLGDGVFPALRVVDPALSNLPVRPTRLLGREGAVAHARRMLAEHRLVTITAVGGSGKTRVAIEVGEEELAHRPGGVWFVDLTAVADKSELPGAVAGSVGLSLVAGDPAEQVIGYLADKTAMVILDNCEHLIDGCAAFAERFLAARGSTVLLATSREALDVDGERTMVLAPLPSDTSDSPAVQLFTDRATAVDPRFELTDANADTVAEIYTRLDGMPLAIELAAARVTVMNPAELLAGLDRRFQVLSGGRRRQRQRTLEATLDWSYDLLEPEEQRVFRALGVFVDGFDLDAVAAVTDRTRHEALDVIESLVAKSVVERSDRAGGTRFRLLETMKAYAEDRLVDEGETVVRERHLEYFHSRAMRDGRIVAGDIRVGLELRADIANITGAFHWAGTTDQWTRAGELLLGSSGAFDVELAWLEGVGLLDHAIVNCARLDVELTERMKALRIGWFVYTWDPRLGPSLLELITSPVPEAQAMAVCFGAFLGAARGDPASEAAIAHAQQVIASILLDDPDADVHMSRAELLNAQGMYAASRRDLQTALHHFEELIETDGPLTIFHVRTGFPTAALLQALLGRRNAALDTLDRMEQHEIPRVIGEHACVMLAIHDGDLEEAAHHARVHATRASSGRYVGEAGDSLCLLAALDLAEGHRSRAAVLSRSLQPRTPAGVILAMYVGEQLDELDDYLRRAQATGPDQFESNARRDLATLREEMTRRGWA